MNALLAMFGVGGWEVVLILAVFLLLFGAKRLPDLAKGLGSSIKEFKKATREVTDEIQNAANDTPPPAPKAPANTTAQTQTQPAAPQTPPQTKVI
jgi:sec-independent protein translocase protein TatA